jgi:lysozyme
MKTSDNGIKLIREFEGCELTAYKCPADKWTIGYGNTFYQDGTLVKKGDKITKLNAEKLMLDLLPKYELIVIRALKAPLTINQNQFDALVSHTWNTGGSQTLFKLINSHASNAAIRNWFETRYIKVDDEIVPGLVKRRKIEADLFCK